MGNSNKIFENSLFEKCPNCGDNIYHGRVNDQCGMIFYYKVKLNFEEKNMLKYRIGEEGVRIGYPIADTFNQAMLCRSCLLIFFRINQYRPLGKNITRIFNMNLKQLQGKIKLLAKEPLAFKKCPLCNNMLDTGYITDYPPGGVMPGTMFHMNLHVQSNNKRKYEPIIIAEDFYQNFFEAYMCNSCLIVIAFVEKFKPLYEDFWDRFERPSRRVVIALEERIKKLDDEFHEIERLNSNKESVEENFSDKLPYEYLSSIKSFLDPVDFYQFCPNCGVENSSKHAVCRKCGAHLQGL
ncbi:MAG: hypothetical protein QW327_05230 [Candidatus Odinarchaeota archaeon]